MTTVDVEGVTLSVWDEELDPEELYRCQTCLDTYWGDESDQRECGEAR